MILIDGSRQTYYEEETFVMKANPTPPFQEVKRCFFKSRHIMINPAIERSLEIVWKHLQSKTKNREITMCLYDIESISMDTDDVMNTGITVSNGTLVKPVTECPRMWLLVNSMCVKVKVLPAHQISTTTFPNQRHLKDMVNTMLPTTDTSFNIICVYDKKGRNTFGTGCLMSNAERKQKLTNSTCGRTQFRCQDGHCISDSYLHDGHRNCPDGSDEMDKFTFTYNSDSIGSLICGPHYFTCASKDCVHWDKLCDDNPDCVDNSDELVCNVLKSTLSKADLGDVMNKYMQCEFVCNKSEVCIPKSQVLDLIPDCPHGEDEVSEIIAGPLCSLSDNIPCMSGHPKCFPIHHICVYDLDTYGLLLNCRNGAHLRHCVEYQCPTRFKCPGSYCIPTKRICDNVIDCPEGDDEADCPGKPLTCPGFFRCREGPCLHLSEVCDGQVDCTSSQDDESGLCHRVPCPSHCHCLGGSMECNTALGLYDAYGLSSFKMAQSEDLSVIQNTATLFNLDLSHGYITRLKAHSLSHTVYPRLLFLDLSFNQINFIERNTFKGLETVVSLTLRNNSLAHVTRHTFEGLDNLVVLNLAQQPLLSVRTVHFQHLTKLMTLNMSFCELTKLELGSSELTTLMDVSGNQLQTITGAESIDIFITIINDHPYTCCLNAFNCTVEKAYGQLCSSQTNPVKTVMLGIYGCSLLIENTAQAIYLKHRWSSHSTILLVLFAGLADAAQGLHVLMLVVKDPLFDRGMVHDINTAKHQWCVSAAWLQIASPAVSLTLKALQIWDNYRKALRKVVVLEKTSRYSLFRVSSIALLISLLYACPVIHTLLAYGELPNVSQFCSFSYLTGTTSIRGHVLLLLILPTVPIIAMFIGCYRIDNLLKSAKQVLEGFGEIRYLKKRHNFKWQPVVKAILSAFVILVSITTYCVVCFMPYNDWIHGVWFALVYSIPAFSQPILQLTTSD